MVLGIINQCSSKGQTKSKWFFQADISSKKQTNEFYFTTMKPQVDLFLFVFWKKLKTPKRHCEINWPLLFYILSWGPKKDYCSMKGYLVKVQNNHDLKFAIMKSIIINVIKVKANFKAVINGFWKLLILIYGHSEPLLGPPFMVQ